MSSTNRPATGKEKANRLIPGGPSWQLRAILLIGHVTRDTPPSLVTAEDVQTGLDRGFQQFSRAPVRNLQGPSQPHDGETGGDEDFVDVEGVLVANPGVGQRVFFILSFKGSLAERGP